MALQIPQGYRVTSLEPIDNRLLLTKEQMKYAKDEWMPQAYFCVCSEPEITPEGKVYFIYLYSKDNTKNDETGRFRKFAGDYNALLNLPRINGVPVKGSEGTGKDYKLQDLLEEVFPLVIDRDSEAHKATIRILYDDISIKSSEGIGLYVDGKAIDLSDNSEITGLKKGLEDEEAARLAGDSELAEDIKAEEEARIAGDSELAEDIKEEETARILADSELAEDIAEEEAARIAADSELQDAIDSEARTRAREIARLDSEKQDKLIDIFPIRISDSEHITIVFDDRTIKSSEGVGLYVPIDEETIILNSEGLHANIDNRTLVYVSSEGHIRVREQALDLDVNPDFNSERAARILGDNELRIALNSEIATRTSEVERLDARIDSEADRIDELELRVYFAKDSAGNIIPVHGYDNRDQLAVEHFHYDENGDKYVPFDFATYLGKVKSISPTGVITRYTAVDNPEAIKAKLAHVTPEDRDKWNSAQNKLVLEDTSTVSLFKNALLMNPPKNGIHLGNTDPDHLTMISLRVDNKTIRVDQNSEFLYLAADCVLPITSEGGLVIITNSEGKPYWVEPDFGKVDDVRINNKSIVSNKIANIRLRDGLKFYTTSESATSEGLWVILEEIVPNAGHLANYKLKALTVNSEGKLAWGEAGKVDGVDIVEDTVPYHLPIQDKFVKLNIGTGLDFPSEGTNAGKLIVDLEEIAPFRTVDKTGKAGKALTVTSEGNLIWEDAGKVDALKVRDALGHEKQLDPVNKIVTINVDKGLQITSEGKIIHINEVAPQTRAANQILMPIGTDAQGHIIDNNASAVANGLREVTFKSVRSTAGDYLEGFDWAYVKDPTAPTASVGTTNVGLKIAGIANVNPGRYDNASLKIDANGLSANYKALKQRVVSTDSEAELIIINGTYGDKLSLNQSFLNRLQLLENAKNTIDSEGIRDTKFYPTIQLLDTELNTKQDLLTPVWPITISSEQATYGQLEVHYDGRTIIQTPSEGLRAGDVILSFIDPDLYLHEILPPTVSEGDPLVNTGEMQDAISSNLGKFIGNYDSEGSLPTKAQYPTLERNDYAFITVPVFDSEGNVNYYYHRYKYVDDTSETGHWQFEYQVSGSTFTYDQLQALNSKWSLQLTNAYKSHVVNGDPLHLHVTQAEKNTWNAKQDALSAGDHINATSLAGKVIKVDTSGTTITDATNSTHPIETNAAKAYFKKKQTPVTTNTVITSEGAYFIAKITQDDQGVITPEKYAYTYATIPNKPSINSVELVGNKVTEDLIQVKDGIKIDTDHKIAHTNAVTATASGAYLGSATAIPRLQIDAQGHISGYASQTVYPPTTAGTAGQVWKSKGSGVGEWAAVPTDGTTLTTNASNQVTHVNAITANTTNSLKTFTYDTAGHITAATNKTLGRGLSDATNVIGHSNAAITANTTNGLKTFAVDEYGHTTAYTAKTLGRGINDQSNVIGHSNSVAAAANVGQANWKVPYFSYDSEGHITASGTKDLWPSLTGQTGKVLAVNSTETGVEWKAGGGSGGVDFTPGASLEMTSEAVLNVTFGPYQAGPGITIDNSTYTISAVSTAPSFSQITGAPTDNPLLAQEFNELNSEIASKQDILTAGFGIEINSNVVSAAIGAGDGLAWADSEATLNIISPIKGEDGIKVDGGWDSEGWTIKLDTGAVLANPGKVPTGQDVSDYANANFKKIQTPVADVTASGSTTEFISSVTQDAQGKITVEKKALDLSGINIGNGTISISVAGSAAQTFSVNQATPSTLSFPISYNSLTDKPTIPTMPTVNNATLSIQNGDGTTTYGTFTANAASNVAIKIPAGTVVDIERW